MRFFAFLVSLVLSLSLLYALSNTTHLPQSPEPIPPLGNLFNPFRGFWQNGECTEYQSFALDLPDLEQTVEIAFDKRLVPHIFAQNEKDLLFAQGYVIAMHRLFQMDLSTRAVSGRLAEVLGEKLLPRDMLQRRKGLVFAAANSLKVWKQSPSFEKLEAYTAGINAYIQAMQPKDYPIEFKLLDYTPELWTPFKTILMLKNMAQTLCMREHDLEASNTLALLGEETYEFLYADNNPKESPVIPREVKWDFIQKKHDSLFLSTLNQILPLPRRKDNYPPEGIGSNNWALSGKKTITRKPILCNDPHLPLTLPSIWYEVQLHTPELNAYGVSLPGVPGVVIGFNENIAWGMTNVGHDVLDWYRIQWAEANKESYFYDGKIKQVDKVIEEFKVRGKAMVYDTVKYTIWGPITYEEEGHDKQDLAMRWLPHLEPLGPEIEFISKLNKASNYDEYVAAIKHHSSPAQNFVFADRHGDIALKVQGRFPLKRKGQGAFVQDGSKSSNDWQGFIPEPHNPAVKNPKRAFVSSANQRSTAEDYPYSYNGSFEDWRGRTLNNYLEKMNNATIQDMMDLQLSTFSLKAKEALELMLPLVNRTNLEQEEREYLRQLDQWSCRYDAESTEAILFEEWFDYFYDMTWDEMIAAQKQKDILFPEEWRTIFLLENYPNNIFFDIKATKQKENAKMIVNQSFKKMCADISAIEQAGESLLWKDQLKFSINHLLRRPFFSARNLPVGGTPNALNAIRRNGFGPSWRMVVSFEDDFKAYGIYPGGQSGNPGSVYYDHMIEPWTKGEYYELLFVNEPEELGDNLLFKMTLQ